MSAQTNQALIRKLKEWSKRGRSLLLENTQANRNETNPRRWKGKDLADLVGVRDVRYIYKAESSGVLPADFREERNANQGYTLEMAMQAMEVFGTLPHRREDEPPAILSFTTYKGGAWKTSCAWHFAMCAATKGYRVLVADLDPQGTMTKNTGFTPDVDTSFDTTLGPLLLDPHNPPTRSEVSSIIRGTHISTLDLLPSSLELQKLEWALGQQAMTMGKDAAGCFVRLADAINLVADDYDLIIMDGTPSLGMLSLNILFSSHAVIMPVPTEMPDFASTMSFIDLAEEHFESAVGLFGDDIALPEMYALPTKFNAGANTRSSLSMLEDFIRPTFVKDVLRTSVLNHKSAVGASTYFSRTMFEVNATELPVSSEARKRCMKNYTEVFNEIMERAVFPYWPSKLRDETKPTFEEAEV